MASITGITVPSPALLLPFLSLLVVGPVPSLPADEYAVASPRLFYPLLLPPTPLFLIAVVEIDGRLQTLSHGLCYRAPSTTISISSAEHRWPPPSPFSPLCPLRHHGRPSTPSPSSPVITMASPASPLHPRFTIGSCSTLKPDTAVTSAASLFSTVASPSLHRCRCQHRRRPPSQCPHRILADDWDRRASLPQSLSSLRPPSVFRPPSLFSSPPPSSRAATASVVAIAICPLPAPR